MSKKIVILGGGTNTYISNHLALSAPAFGNTAIELASKFNRHLENKMDVQLILTKMASSGIDATSFRHRLRDCDNEILELTSIPNRTEREERLLQSRYSYKARLESYLGSFEGSNPDTPEDIETIVDKLIADPDIRVIIFNVAMVDYRPEHLEIHNDDNNIENVYEFGKYNRRLNSKKDITIHLTPYNKIIQKIRKERKDILLVGFKTTCGATKEEQYNKGLKLCKDSSANIVFVNDVDKDHILALKESLKGLDLFQGPTYGVGTYDPKLITPYISKPKTHCENEKEMLERAVSELQNNGLVTPEESSYWYNTRDEALDALVQMVLDRSHLHFTRSTVVDSETIDWNNKLIPETFKTIFDFVRGAGAYKLGPTKNTVGHFGIALGPNEFLTSKRKTDFNKIEEVGLVRVITNDPDNIFGYKHFFEEDNKDKVIAFGAKPSVGGQSQRSLFDTFPDLDCIIHFHCPLKPESRSLFNTTKQFSYECGSKECIASNLTGFKEYKVSDTHSIWAGHMDYHGPNIVFNSNINPQLVIDFISSHWDLSKKTTGLSSELI